MPWTKSSILAAIRARAKRGEAAYRQVAAEDVPLISAAAYHFGSYRAAVEATGIDYAGVSRRPRWTKQSIIAVIKRARRRHADLHWSAVRTGGGELARAAFAAKRLFGSWKRALHAAGLDGDDLAAYYAWDKPTILYELRGWAAEGIRGSRSILAQDPRLHAAAIRHFGAFTTAMKLATTARKTR